MRTLTTMPKKMPNEKICRFRFGGYRLRNLLEKQSAIKKQALCCDVNLSDKSTSLTPACPFVSLGPWAMWPEVSNHLKEKLALGPLHVSPSPLLRLSHRLSHAGPVCQAAFCAGLLISWPRTSWHVRNYQACKISQHLTNISSEGLTSQC